MSDEPDFEDRDHAHAREFRSPVSTGDFYNALRAKGFTPAAAAGITGNAIHESGGNADRIWLDPPTGPETGDAAHGAMQWEGARRRGLHPTLDSTVNKIYDEISSGSQGITLGQVNSARSPEAAASMLNHQYERPQYPAQSEGYRERYAAETYRRYAGPGVPGAAAHPGTIVEGGSGSYLADRQRQKDEERTASSHSSIAHRGTAAGVDHHYAHLRQIHEQIALLHNKHADLEARHERTMRKGVITDVNTNNQTARMEIGRDCDGSNQVKSPWLPYAQHAGDLKHHSPPSVGQQSILFNPDGSPDFSQGLISVHGWYTQQPSPSTDPNADVTTRGTTIHVRTASSIAHSIGGTLSGPLMSLISGGITLLHDALGHHTSAPGATVDSSAQTHSHTSSGSHTDTATQDIAHNAGQNVSRTAQNGNIDCTAMKGNITHNASKGAINNSATTMGMSTPGTVVSIT
jgi:phage baseplate assembly protein gpV